MRIRTIKPGFWSSADISDLDVHTRLLFIGLWNYVDDEGRGRDDLALVATSLFPHDLCRSPHDTLTEVSRGLSELSSRGLIRRYEVDGARFMAVVTWEKHQRVNRPSKSDFPPPPEGGDPTLPQNDAIPEDDASPHGGLTEGSLNPHGALSAGIRNREEGRGNRESSPLHAPRSDAAPGDVEDAPPQSSPEGADPTTTRRDTTTTAPKRKPAAGRGTRIAEDWKPSPQLVEWTRANCPDINPDEVDRFRDYWISRTGAAATKRDWNATWRNWARRAQDDARARQARAGYRNQNQIIADERRRAAAATAAMQAAGWPAMQPPTTGPQPLEIPGNPLKLIEGEAS